MIDKTSGYPSKCRPTFPRISVSGLFVVIAACALLAGASARMAHAQESVPDEQMTVRTFQVNHANVRHLKSILKPLVSENGSIGVDKRTNLIVIRDTEASLKEIGKIITRLDGEMPSQMFRLRYADCVEVTGKVKRALGSAAKIVEPYPRTNALYVATTPPELERAKALIAKLDKPARQVLIEVDILDVSSGKLKELGIDWELRLGYAGGDHDAVINIGTGRVSPDEPATGTIMFGIPTITVPAVYAPDGSLITPPVTIPGSDFSANIQALVEDSSTRTLSRPRIVVLDGHPARFEVSTLEPYANTHYSESGNATSLDIQFMDIGIILETVPHINDEGYVVLDVRPEISTLVREEFFETTIIPDEGGAITSRIRVPVKSQSRADTTVMIRDGQTIAIGGLGSSGESESIRKVPILGDIPILGIPFRNINKSKEERELIIFITPRIISPDVSSPEMELLERAEVSEEQD